ncbi:MarR family transcriptional regulator [Komagataeibacter xylinus]|uniref:MarR family transcriptional regulator n=1 Tax=Komagataeibacter xylinus TaxID=28448 RepID=A0A318PT66_KOMXY|nr:MarR family transcriptional regulator [Komagataeibacter xylinus]AZV39828.1 MarR family transcriptional regulator [Komagataeibacter xylinus]PYD56751.1 MarR family transcriptional regulator [Komagataeibacter xylinus]GBQ74106.1 transcriptional regulator [Komagataeibacter xylinus NBRC 15237]
MSEQSTLADPWAEYADGTTRPVGRMQLRVWLRMLSCTHLIERCVRKLLRRKFDTTLPRFDVLAQLDASNGMLSMGDLSKRLMVTTGNVTGLIDLMEQEELVERLPHPSDRRITLVQITARGEQLCAAALPAHQEWIQTFLQDLTEEELRQLYGLLSKAKVAISTREAQLAKTRAKSRR